MILRSGDCAYIIIKEVITEKLHATYIRNEQIYNSRKNNNRNLDYFLRIGVF